MRKIRVNALLAACAVCVSPSIAMAQTATVTDDQALCVAAPDLPSCAGSTGSTVTGESVEVGSDQKVMRLVSLAPAAASSSSSARTVAPAARPGYVAPAPGRSSPRLVAPSRGTATAQGRMQLAPVMTGSDMVVTFRSGKADLTPQAIANLRVYARALKNPVVANRNYVVEGHTDAVGNAATNRTLSQRRAESVVAALVAEGVPATRLEARGFGAMKLRYPGRPGDGGNRRVELVKSK